MLVEDDPVFIRTLSERLQDEGHSTREFLDPEEAKEFGIIDEVVNQRPVTDAAEDESDKSLD